MIQTKLIFRRFNLMMTLELRFGGLAQDVRMTDFIPFVSMVKRIRRNCSNVTSFLFEVMTKHLSMSVLDCIPRSSE